MAVNDERSITQEVIEKSNAGLIDDIPNRTITIPRDGMDIPVCPMDTEIAQIEHHHPGIDRCLTAVSSCGPVMEELRKFVGCCSFVSSLVTQMFSSVHCASHYHIHRTDLIQRSVSAVTLFAAA
jgi:hypothetical protein